MPQHITLVKVRRIPRENVNEELQWLGNSLGLFSLRDKDSSCFRIFITLVKKSRREEPLSSDDIAAQLQLSRGTVVHHLSKLIDTGIVIRSQEGYVLRENSLQRLLQDIRQDLESQFSEMATVAREIDERLG